MKKLLGILMLFLVLLWPVSADAARLLTTGIEENDLATNSTIWNASFSAPPVVVTSPVRSGTYALQVKTTSAEYQWVRWNYGEDATTGTFYSRIPFYIATAPAATVDIFATIGTNSQQELRLTSGRALSLVNIQDSSSISGGTLALATWYVIEVKVTLSATVGALELKMDGVSQGTLSNKNTIPDGNFRFASYGPKYAYSTYEFYYDDLAINNDSGSFQNSWCGLGKVAFTKPVSDVSVQWTRNGGAASNAATVANLPGAPNDATYNSEATTLNHVDRFAIAALPAEVTSGATMVVMDVYARVGSDSDASDRYGRLKAWDNVGSLTDGPSIRSFRNTGFIKLNSFFLAGENLALDISSKTKAQVEAYNIGYENITDDATRPRYVSELWANVEWLPGAGASAAKRRIIAY